MLMCILNCTNTWMLHSVSIPAGFMQSRWSTSRETCSPLQWDMKYVFVLFLPPHFLLHLPTSNPLLIRIPCSSLSLLAVFPPLSSSQCGHLAIKRGWVSHLPFRPLIVWHTMAQLGSHHQAWIRWPDYLPAGFHFPRSHVLHWQQGTHNEDEASQMTNQSASSTYHNMCQRNTQTRPCWHKGLCNSFFFDGKHSIVSNAACQACTSLRCYFLGVLAWPGGLRDRWVSGRTQVQS